MIPSLKINSVIIKFALFVVRSCIHFFVVFALSSHSSWLIIFVLLLCMNPDLFQLLCESLRNLGRAIYRVLALCIILIHHRRLCSMRALKKIAQKGIILNRF